MEKVWKMLFPGPPVLSLWTQVQDKRKPCKYLSSTLVDCTIFPESQVRMYFLTSKSIVEGKGHFPILELLVLWVAQLESRTDPCLNYGPMSCVTLDIFLDFLELLLLHV